MRLPLCLLFAAFVLAISCPIASCDEFIAVGHERTTVYHSPETPGYTCWTGAWAMPDGSLMVCFTQATGPAEGRPQAPGNVRKLMDWPPPGRPDYDMTGLDLRNVHLRSTDGGKTWAQASADPFKSCMNGVAGEAEMALPDGTVLRSVFGYYLPYDPELPKGGYLQRSTDRTKTWGNPEVLLDPAQVTAFPKRIRQLRDGRLIIVGGIAYVPANSRNREAYCDLFEPLLLVSKDAGKSWSGPIRVVPEKYRGNWGGEECDAAELPNGDLLFVFRRRVPELKAEARWQGVMKKSGDTWTVAEAGPAPLPHSGHPELLATKEGPVLHIATDGIRYTVDAGATWQKFDIPGTAYYPHAVQARDGQIFIFGHAGSDDPYGKVDQSIIMDRFQIKTK